MIDNAAIGAIEPAELMAMIPCVEHWLGTREQWTLAELLDVVLDDDELPTAAWTLMWATEWLREQGRVVVTHFPSPAGEHKHTADDVLIWAGEAGD